MHSFFPLLRPGLLGPAILVCCALCPVLARGGIGRPTLESGVVRNASEIVPEPEGKVVAIGEPPDEGGPLAVIRLKSDGGIDRTFNASALGLLSLDSIRRLPSGKFLLAGSFMDASGQAALRLVKLESNGRVDAGFRPGRAFAPRPIVQSDRRLLLLGSSKSAAGGIQPVLARLNPDGSPDASFHPAVALLAGGAYALGLQADGKLLVIGEDGASSGQPSLQRLETDGSLDPKFRPAAAVADGYGVCALAQTPEGKLLVAEYASADHTVCTLNRLKEDGSPDPDFQPPAPLRGRIGELAGDAAGRVIFAGSFTEVNGSPRPGFARLREDGRVDQTFDPFSDASAGFDGFVATAAGDVTFARGLTAAESVGFPGAPGILLEQLGADGSSVLEVKIASCPSCQLVPAKDGMGVYVRVETTSASP
jgi:uncharacterized delta-60 repeat protein